LIGASQRAKKDFEKQKGIDMNGDFPRTCVSTTGEFVFGIHKPQFSAFNLRENDHIESLGRVGEKEVVGNAGNFPKDHVTASSSSWVYEIPNAFPFMGATFILKSSADRSAGGCNPFKRKEAHAFGTPSKISGKQLEDAGQAYGPSMLALAKTSTDPAFLGKLAEKSCRFTYDEKTGRPNGMCYERTEDGQLRPAILDWHLFELVSNNPSLPDVYKRTMVLVPGAQGDSPIVGEYAQQNTHIWEYLRENSYIPWGHYAANMAHDAIRYTISSLSFQDVIGLRHLYYQRIYGQLAAALGIAVAVKRRPLTREELEDLRQSLVDRIEEYGKRNEPLMFNATVWGQNFGFDLSPSGYRLNASHQQVHQQYALVPSFVPGFSNGEDEPSIPAMQTFIQGDLVAEFADQFEHKTKRPFFDAYLKAIRDNKRMDGRRDKKSALIYHEDENIVAFVPKAQRSQGEVQIMTKGSVGNIIEADDRVRRSMDRGILLTMKLLENLGAEMITAFELAKRFDELNRDQRLIYCFLPKHPQSPGSLTELQQRWIMGHYPEDFAEACRKEVEKIGE
jgi:galactose-1-phosphate uridylyltransferase